MPAQVNRAYTLGWCFTWQRHSMNVSHGGRRILVVDDDRSTLVLLSQILRNAGYAVSEASCGQAALESVLHSEPDLALLDVGLPGMSGVELAERLVTQTSVPFMFLSASGDAEIVKQATAYGAVSYHLKPIDPVRVLAAMKTGLAQADEIRRLRHAADALTVTLASEREINLAVGLLMARYKTDRTTAFNVLRDHAQASRRKVNEIARELLFAEETLNTFTALFSARSRTR